MAQQTATGQRKKIQGTGPAPEVSSADADDTSLEAPGPDTAAEPIARFRDVPMTIGVRLDHKLVKFKEILELQTGSVIQLDRSAGENVDLLLNDYLIGNGEIVVIEDTMGLRITDLAFLDAPTEEQ